MIQGELYAERKNREETYDKIIKKLGNDILRVNEILNTEKKVIFGRFWYILDKRWKLCVSDEEFGRDADEPIE